MTQKPNVLAHLRSGKSITPMEALNKYGCFRLADVIYRLRRDGHRISATRIEVATREGTARVARYRLESD